MDILIFTLLCYFLCRRVHVIASTAYYAVSCLAGCSFLSGYPSYYGSDSNLLKVVEKFALNLASAPSLRQPSGTDDSAPQPKIFNFVKRTGSSIKNRLVKVKQLALNTGIVGTQPCKKKNSLPCPAISSVPVHRINGHNIRPHSGTCTT